MIVGDGVDGFREAVGVGDPREGVERVVGVSSPEAGPSGVVASTWSTVAPASALALGRRQREADREGVAGRQLERLLAHERGREGRRLEFEAVDGHRLVAGVLDAHDESARLHVETPLLEAHLETVGQRGGGVLRGRRARDEQHGRASRGRRRARASGRGGRAASGSSGHRTETSRRRPPSERGSAARRAATSSIARAAGSSGAETTTGVPASPPWRRAMLSGTLASSGTGCRLTLGEALGDERAAAGAEQLDHAVGPREPGHVLDHADDPSGRSGARRRPTALGDVGRGGLRGRHDDHLGVRQQLAERDRDVARAGRQVDEQHVEVAEVHVGEELLERAVQHRAAPRDRDG